MPDPVPAQPNPLAMPESPSTDPNRAALIPTAPMSGAACASADEGLKALEAIHSKVSLLMSLFSGKFDMINQVLGELRGIKQNIEQAMSTCSEEFPLREDRGACVPVPGIGNISLRMEIMLDVLQTGVGLLYAIQARDQPGLRVIETDLVGAFNHFRMMLNALHTVNQSIPMIEESATVFGVFGLAKS
jgi:hypothetical protein